MVCVALHFFAQSTFAQMRDFTSSQGSRIRAELVSHKGGKVTLKREDGKTFAVAPSMFGAADQRYIAAWMENNPPSISYRFDIEVDKEKLSGDRVDLGYKKVKNEKWAYQVTITNTSRDTTDKLKVRYKLFYSNYADGEFSASSSDRTGMAVVSGQTDIKTPLRFNQSKEFISKSVTLDNVDYDYSPRYKDSLKGIMLRIEDSRGQVVCDWVMPITYLAGKNWDSFGK